MLICGGAPEKNSKGGGDDFTAIYTKLPDSCFRLEKARGMERQWRKGVNNLNCSQQAQVNSVISAKKERGQGSPAMDSKWVNKMLCIYLQHYSTF